MASKTTLPTELSRAYPRLFVIHHNKPGSVVDEHQHDGHELIIPIAGEVTISAQNKKFTCRPGSMIFIPHDTGHAFSNKARHGERLIAIIDPALVPATTGLILHLPSYQLVKELLYQLILDHRQEDADTYITAFGAALRHCLSSSHYRDGLSQRLKEVRDVRLQKAIDLLQRSVSQEISIPELAKQAGLSERSLHRLFRLELELSPKEVLAQLRVAAAVDLLQSGKHNVTQTAMEVGYSSLSQFIQLFKGVTGRLPSDFL